MRPGERLKEAREKLNLSQAEFGASLGFTYSKVRDLESGKQKITLEIAEQIEVKFSIPRRWLLEGLEPTENAPSDFLVKEEASPYIASVAAMMREMDEDTQKDIFLSVQKEKLLRELLRERMDRKVG